MAQPKDDLNPTSDSIVEDVLQEIAPSESSEAAPPQYMTRDEFEERTQQIAKDAESKAERRWQAVSDARITRSEQRSKAAEKAALSALKQQMDALPPEERREMQLDELWRQSQASPEESDAPVSQPNLTNQWEALLESAREHALEICDTYGANPQDARLNEGISSDMPVSEQLKKFKANARKYGTSNAGQGAQPNPSANGQRRQPPPVMEGAQKTNSKFADPDAVYEWYLAHQGEPGVHKTYVDELERMGRKA